MKKRKPIVIDDLVTLRGAQIIENNNYILPTPRSIFPDHSEGQRPGKATELFVYADRGTTSWKILNNGLTNKRRIRIFKKELYRLLKEERYYTTIPEEVNAISISNPFGSYVFCISLYSLPHQHYLLERGARRN